MLTKKRDIFQEGLNTELTQGSVFIKAYSESYPKAMNYGIIVTARCDISQKKAKINTYLPVVPISSWMDFDFLEILNKRCRGQVENAFKSQFEAIGGSMLVFKTYGVEKIKSHFFDPPLSAKQKRALDTLEKIELLDAVSFLESREVSAKKYLEKFPKESESILKELVSQNLSGYYFIDDVCGDGPHIVLLRETYHLSQEDALSLRVGCKINNLNINYEDGDFSYTIGVVRSPYLEHIMQKFSELFTRIGIDDPEPDAAKNLLTGIISE